MGKQAHIVCLNATEPCFGMQFDLTIWLYNGARKRQLLSFLNKPLPQYAITIVTNSYFYWYTQHKLDISGVMGSFYLNHACRCFYDMSQS